MCAGPVIVELMTYRYSGHSMSDPGTTYRTREEIQHVRANRDPIKTLEEHIRSVKEWAISEQDFKRIEGDAKHAVEEAVERAKADPEPSGEDSLFRDITPDPNEPSRPVVTIPS